MIRRRSNPPTLPSRAAYAKWATSYPPHAHNPLMQAEQDAMLALLPDVRGKTLVDLACGSGRYGRLASERGAAYVVGVDDSQAMLYTGQAADVPMAFVLGELTAVPLSGRLADVVVCGLAIGHLKRLRRALQEMKRLLAPGGTILISDFHPSLFAAGGRRTFTGDDGRTYSVEHHTHSLTAVQALAADLALVVEHIAEPTMSVNGRKQPVVVVYRLRLAV